MFVTVKVFLTFENKFFWLLDCALVFFTPWFEHAIFNANRDKTKQASEYNTSSYILASVKMEQIVWCWSWNLQSPLYTIRMDNRCYHHGFASLTKIKLRKSTFPAGTLVTYQAYAGSTSSVAVTAGKGLVGVWCYGCTFLLWRFSSMADLREDSKEEAALLIVWRHVPRSSARVVHSRWLMLHAPRDFFRMSL